MKIISNFKDYYDYLQGVYGIDEKVAYERLCKQEKREYENGNLKKCNIEKIPLYRPEHIGDDGLPRTIIGDINSGKLMGKPIAVRYDIAICGIKYVSWAYMGKYYIGEMGEKILQDAKVETGTMKSLGKSSYFYTRNGEIKDGEATTINTDYNCPVVLIKHQPILNVRLTDFGINQVISPHDMYVMISNFITREKPVADTRTNVEKIEGKGFDKKTSFRHPIK